MPVITLSDGTDTITLHPDLYWTDETAWHEVEQSIQRTITGALVVSAAGRIAGRPITLQPEDGEGSAWMPRTTVDALRNWAAVAGKQMTLTLRGQTYTVIFRHHDGAGFEATPIQHRSDVQGADWYTVVIRLMEI